MKLLKNIFCICILFFSATSLVAQQDPQYSQYMFNQLVINPAYAGSKEALTSALFLRNQWTGIDGSPSTESISLHGPLKGKKVGLGFTIIADQIGVKKSIGALGSYAYRIPIKNGKLSLGIRVGIYKYTFNWDKLTHEDPTDPVYIENAPAKIVPTADAGIYYYNNSMYVGLSATHLYNGRLTSISAASGKNSKLSAHYFITLGKAWAFSDKLVFNPSFIIKSAENAPATCDLNLSFLLKQRIWLGLSARSGYGLVVYTQVNINDKFRIGYAFDYGMNRIGQVGGGSHEIMLSYDFNSMKSKINSPRYL